MRHPLCFFLSLLLLTGSSDATIVVNGVTDRSYYNDQATFTVITEAGYTTAATLNGTPVTVGGTVTVTGAQYYELFVTKTPTGGGVPETRQVQFIIRASERGSSESGLPAWVPYRLVNDAPSAFAGGVLNIVAPAQWPKGMPIPVAALLHDSLGEGLRLNGVVRTTSFPTAPIQLRRGFGAVLLPSVETAGAINLDAAVNGLSKTVPVTIENSTTWTNVSGSLASSTTWGANGRYHVTSTLTIPAGSTLTVAAGTIVQVAPGAEIVVDGTLQVNGTSASPVVFTPETPSTPWGGVELNVSTSRVIANGTIFTGSGADATWFDTHSGYSSHRKEQALFLVGASGAELHLSDCWAFDLKGQAMNSKSGAVIDLKRTLIQRCTTGGELNGSTVTVDRSAIIEIPSDDTTFVDGDNDGIYLTNGTQSITRTVIGWTKDDGVDSGGNGGTGTVTTMTNNWYDSVFHEGNSLSGVRNVTFTGCVFSNCGQGVEDGYTNGSDNGATGPTAVVDGCLFNSNLVGVRFGDNYNWYYNGTIEAKNSLLVGNFYHDAWGFDWTSWSYAPSAKLNVHDCLLTEANPKHPQNTPWSAAAAARLASFMPVPDSNVGVAIHSWVPQADTSKFPSEFAVRLSTFSSRAVNVDYKVIAKTDPLSETEATLASGTLAFTPGETVKTVSTPVTSPERYALIRVVLSNPVNAEITGEESWYFKTPPGADPNLVSRASNGWHYREERSDPPADWKQLGFDDSSAAAVEWKPATLPAGFGTFSGVTFGTTVTPGSSTDRTRTFYFRKRFNVADPATIKSLTFNVRRDDGVIAWLNNNPVPIATSGITAPASYSTFATNATDTTTYFTFTVSPALLLPGENILAVEVHQSSATSSDLLLDCNLTATRELPLKLEIGKAGGQPVLFWFDSAAQLEESVDLRSWTPKPGTQSPWPMNISGPQRFYRLRK